MTYVAISGELLDRVSAKISKMKIKELDTLGVIPDTSYDEKSEYFLSLIWGEHLHLKSILPKEFMSDTKNLFLRYENGDNHTRKYISFNNPMLTPPAASNTIENVDWEQLELFELKKFLDSEYEINKRWYKTNSDVTGFLKKCKSLNEAIKLWPDVEAYLASHDLNRVKTKKEKVEKTNAALEALKDLDTDALVANAVIARMSGA